MKKQVPTKNVGQCDILCAAGFYEAPATWRNSVETEGCFCESDPVQVKMENATIEVEEWAEVGDEVSFD